MGKKALLLVGTGVMGKAYAKVLQAQRTPFVAVGRGKERIKQFEDETGVNASFGGIEAWLQHETPPPAAIIAVSVEELRATAQALMAAGVRRILLEKPGGLTPDDIRSVKEEADRVQAQVFIAYNRRFYNSVMLARQIIRDDGGVQSFHFDFTERSTVLDTERGRRLKTNRFLANATHVIDLAFFLGGNPSRMHGVAITGPRWAPEPSVFSGSGETLGGALFSYHANWEGPGRWGVSLVTQRHKLILCPLERLQVQESGSFDIREVLLPNALDEDFKPGLYRQVEAFMKEGQDALLSIDEQAARLYYFESIRRPDKAVQVFKGNDEG